VRWQWDVLDAFRYGRPWSWLMSIGRFDRSRQAREGRHPALVVDPAEPHRALRKRPTRGRPAHRHAGVGAAHARELP
jgi:hypothetical protein